MKNDFLKSLNMIKGVIVKENVVINSSINIKATFKYKIVIDRISSIKKVFELINKYKVKYYIIGNCTNILFLKNYYNGALIEVILKSNGFVLSGKEDICALNRRYIKEGISSFLFLTLVPASLGGAIYMNAGAYTKEIKDIVEYVYFYDIDNKKIMANCHYF